MTRIVDLLNALTAVIVRYHDTHASSLRIDKVVNEPAPSLVMTKTLKYAATLLKGDDYKDKIQDLIKACTASYAGRTPFLYYLLNEITYLKSIQDQNTSPSSEQLGQYQQDISRMLFDFKKLLSIYKGATYQATHHKHTKPDAKVDLSGLLNDAMVGNKYCISGDLLSEALSQFNFSSNTLDTQIISFATDLCVEYQNALLAQHLSTQIEEAQKLIYELRGEYTSLQQTLKSTQTLNQKQESEIAVLRSQLSTALTEQSSLRNLQDELSAARIKVAEQEQMIAKLKPQQANAPKYPPYPSPFFNTALFGTLFRPQHAHLAFADLHPFIKKPASEQADHEVPVEETPEVSL
jgi:hypothetical protein